MFFLRKPSLERLPVVMSGVRMGERALQIGLGDPSLAGAIAAKVGLSGHAAAAVTGERHAARMRTAAARAGALVDVQVTPFDALPFGDGSFDVVIIHADSVTPSIVDPAALTILRDVYRVLRGGGRLVVIEGPARTGLFGLRVSRRPEIGGMLSALGTAGFRAARELAEREGYRFTEGLKASQP